MDGTDVLLEEGVGAGMGAGVRRGWGVAVGRCQGRLCRFPNRKLWNFRFSNSGYLPYLF